MFFRLWFLQVLTGDDYVVQARENRIRKVKIEAPRGNIVDRDGRTLVKTRAAPVVQILPNSVPDAELEAAEDYRKLLAAVRGPAARGRARTCASSSGGCAPTAARSTQRRARASGASCAPRRARADKVAIGPIPPGEPRRGRSTSGSAAVIDISPRTIHRRVIQGIADQPSANVTIKTDVSAAAFNYLLEHREDFPGVVVEKKYLRHYPYKTLGAPAVRHAARDLARGGRHQATTAASTPGYADRQGRDRGELRQVPARHRRLHARDRQLVRQPRRHAPDDAHGPDPGPPAAADARPRAAARRAERRRARDRGRTRQRQPGRRGRLRRDGPARRRGAGARLVPELRREPVRQADRPGDLRAAQQRGERRAAVQPRDRRRLSDGSTFKPITALAAVDAGIITPSTPLNDPGVFRYGGREFKNARDAVFGTLALPRALQVSSDVFFYQLGAAANERGAIIQQWARKLSFDEPTGIDLPGEYGGLVPDCEVAQLRVRASTCKCAKKAKVPTGTTEALYACGGIERGWSGGDNVNLAVGQGDLQATPLQLATAYATIANGGRVVTPASRPAGRGRRGPPARGDPQAGQAARRHRAGDARRRSGPACAPRPARAAARRRTSSPASPTPSTARPARPSARRTPTSRGTRRTSTTRSSRSSSS